MNEAGSPDIIGYHIVRSAYGQWLPGDKRGSWSTAWDEDLGYIEPHTLHPGDSVRQRMAAERMLHEPVIFTPSMMRAARVALRRCDSASAWSIAALAIAPTHMHLLITHSGLDAHRTAKWIGQQLTRSIHASTRHSGPVWCRGHWCGYVYKVDHWHRAIDYIDQQASDADRNCVSAAR
jgi:REP element-mobilizing transposase RayT